MSKMDVGNGPVESNITGAVSFGFSAENASKLAGMMANFLYSDKEYAVLSELAANAYDAHKMVKKNDPISINLPTHIEPTLVIRDYGPGMSEENVYRFLTQFGESSKQNDNSQIGFWGIGSKSPAAITDTWTIKSYHNGKLHHFEVFMNSEGVPALKKMFESETQESGLEVEIPVPSANTHVWESAAAKAFKHYDIKPKINRNISYKAVNFHVKTDKYGISVHTYQCEVKLITTMREYVVDIKLLKDYISSDEYTYFSTRDIEFYLFFNVGEVDLSISREQIQYNKKTLDSIAARLKLIYSEVKDEVFKFIDKDGTDTIKYRTVLAKAYNTIYHCQFVYDYVTKNKKFGVSTLPNDINKYSVEVSEDFAGRILFGPTVRKLNFADSFLYHSRTRAVSLFSNHAEKKYYVSIQISSIDKIKIILAENIKTVVARIKATYGINSKFVFLIVDKNPFDGVIPAISASSLNKIEHKKNKVESDFWMMNVAVSRFFRVKESDILVKPEKCVSVPIVSATDMSRNVAMPDWNALSVLMKDGYTIIGHKSDKMKYQSVETALSKILNSIKIDIDTCNTVNEYSLMNISLKMHNTLSFILDNQLYRHELFRSALPEMKEIFDVYLSNKIPSSVNHSINKIVYLNNRYNYIASLIKKPALNVVKDYEYLEKICNKKLPLLQYIRYGASNSSDFIGAVLHYAKCNSQ